MTPQEMQAEIRYLDACMHACLSPSLRFQIVYQRLEGLSNKSVSLPYCCIHL